MIEELQQDIREVKVKIKTVERDIEDVKKKLKETRAQLREATGEKKRESPEMERERLEKEKERLEKKEECLLVKKNLYLEKENLYLRKEERLEQQQQATDNEAALVNQIQVPDSYASLYEQLKKGELTDDGRLIEWTEPIALFDNMTKLYVRDCCGDLYDMITKTNDRDSLVRNFVVTGVPGIGKSTFKIYFAWRCSQANEGFLLEEELGDIWLHHPTLQCRKLDRIKARLPTYGLIPYFVDLIEAEEPGARIGKYGVVFSSPNKNRYKQFAKEPNFSLKAVMNTWSDTEIFAAANLLKIPLSKDTLENNLLKVGGVPRYVFYGIKRYGNKDDRKSLDKYLEEAFEEKGSHVASNFHVNGFGTTDAAESYALVHINPPKNDDGTYDYCGHKVYSFASNYVSQRLFEKYYQAVIANARTLFNFNSNLSNRPETGWKFEKCCLFLTPIYRCEEVLSMQRLSHCRASVRNSSSENPDSSVLLVPKEANILTQNSWNSSEKLQQGVFYIPSVSNFESAGAFFVRDGVLNVLQITVGDAHPVKANGLENIYARFFSDDEKSVAASGTGKKKMRKNSRNNARLIFVIPVQGALSSSQPLTTKRGGTLERLSGTARKFYENQWLLRYEI